MTRSAEQPAQRPAGRNDLGREIHHDMERMLERRSAPRDTLRARMEDEAKRDIGRVWNTLTERPSLGAVALGGLAILAANAVGIGELAMGVGMGYVAWKVLRRGEPLDEAVEPAEKRPGA